jgi:hypothetical protein
LKCPWGENDRLQDGPRALFHHTQPGDHLAAGQAFLLRRIDLPDFMDEVRPLPMRRRWTTGGDGRASLGVQPTLESSGAGQIGFAKLVGQLHADAARAPARVLGAQVKCLPIEGIAAMLGSGTAGSIVRLQREGTLSAEGVQEMSHGPEAQLEVVGDLDGRMAIGLALKNGLANGGGNSVRHGAASKRQGKTTRAPRQDGNQGYRNGKTMCRN